MKGPHSSSGRGAWPASPNSTARSTGPTEKVAMPWKLGPSMKMSAVIEIEKVISPIHTSIVTPARIDA